MVVDQRVTLWHVSPDYRVGEIQALAVENMPKTFTFVSDCPTCVRERRRQVLHLGRNVFHTEREAQEEVIRRSRLDILRAQERIREAETKIGALAA